MILTNTPTRNEIALLKKKKPASKIKKTLFKEKKNTSKVAKKTKTTPSSSSSSDTTDVPCDDSSDDELYDAEEIIEGDFVIVKICGKSRVVYYIARVDVVDGDEYEGIFLQRMSGKVATDAIQIFIQNTEDTASFPKSDIVRKLPQPKIIGGSARRSAQLSFKCNLSEWNLQ